MNVKSINALIDIVGLSEGQIKECLYSHSENLGIGLIVTHNGQSLITEDYFCEIENEYSRLSEKVFDVVEIRRNITDLIPYKKGNYVYFLFNGGALVYVGQTISLINRLYEHQKAKVFDGVSFISIDSKDMMDIEMVNIREHKPKYNISKVDNKNLFAFILKRLFS